MIGVEPPQVSLIISGKRGTTPETLKAMSDALGIPIEIFYERAGLPVIHDERGRLWIHGLAFAAWARQTVSLRKSKRAGLPDDCAWCLRCNCPVPLIDPTARLVRANVELLQSTCPTCGATVNRVRRAEARPE